MDRFQVHALSVGDIVELLPENLILNGETTWDEARHAYDQRRTKENFKVWVVRRYPKVPPISVNRVRRAVEQMQGLPLDIQAINSVLCGG